jgi:hypothetical protein
MSFGTIHIYCDSEDTLYPDNQVTDFTVNLAKTLYIPSRWVCAITEIDYPDTLKDTCFLCCDLCDSSLTTNSRRLPILRRLPVPKSNWLPLVYVPIKQSQVNKIHFFLKNKEGKPLDSITGVIHCTLILKPDSP